MSIYANPPVHRAALSELASIEDTDLGTLPRWNLADLYAGSSDPQIDADLDWAAEQARSMAQGCQRQDGSDDARKTCPDHCLVRNHL